MGSPKRWCVRPFERRTVVVVLASTSSRSTNRPRDRLRGDPEEVCAPMEEERTASLCADNPTSINMHVKNSVIDSAEILISPEVYARCMFEIISGTF